MSRFEIWMFQIRGLNTLYSTGPFGKKKEQVQRKNEEETPLQSIEYLHNVCA